MRAVEPLDAARKGVGTNQALKHVQHNRGHMRLARPPGKIVVIISGDHLKPGQQLGSRASSTAT